MVSQENRENSAAEEETVKRGKEMTGRSKDKECLAVKQEWWTDIM